MKSKNCKILHCSVCVHSEANGIFLLLELQSFLRVKFVSQNICPWNFHPKKSFYRLFWMRVIHNFVSRTKIHICNNRFDFHQGRHEGKDFAKYIMRQPHAGNVAANCGGLACQKSIVVALSMFWKSFFLKTQTRRHNSKIFRCILV